MLPQAMNSFLIFEHENKRRDATQYLMKVNFGNIDVAERKRIEPSNGSTTESIASYSYMHEPYHTCAFSMVA